MKPVKTIVQSSSLPTPFEKSNTMPNRAVKNGACKTNVIQGAVVAHKTPRQLTENLLKKAVALAADQTLAQTNESSEHFVVKEVVPAEATLLKKDEPWSTPNCADLKAIDLGIAGRHSLLNLTLSFEEPTLMNLSTVEREFDARRPRILLDLQPTTMRLADKLGRLPRIVALAQA